MDYYFIRQGVVKKCVQCWSAYAFTAWKNCVNILNISFQTPHFLKLPRPMCFCQKALGSHSLICLVGRQIAHCCLSFEITTQQLSSLLRIILMTQTSASSLRMRVMSERFRNVDSTSHFVFSVRSKLHWDRNEQILQSKRKETLPRTPRCVGPWPVFTDRCGDG